MKILIADDNELTRDLMRAFLQEVGGHEIVGEAENGAEAVKSFAELKPDLVLMDLVMPVKTGLEALQDIRAIDPKARIVMVTAVQQDGINQELLAKGAIAILRKPFSYPEFAEALKRLA
jgi:two-component system chemotaxis response regulator CheY